MATLKDHQQAMVDLLANGSGIPSSASRLAHAMHDVLSAMTLDPNLLIKSISESKEVQRAYTTPGLNDKALAGDLEACRPKDTMFDRARAAERRVKELENTVKQLRASNVKLRAENGALKATLEFAETQTTEAQFMAEQAGCRKPDTQCNHTPIRGNDGGTYCNDCGEEL